MNIVGVGMNIVGVGMNVDGVGMNIDGEGMNIDGVNMNIDGVGMNIDGVGMNIDGVVKLKHVKILFSILTKCQATGFISPVLSSNYNAGLSDSFVHSLLLLRREIEEFGSCECDRTESRRGGDG
ncbi:ATPase involved in DNA repair [Plakobranchus ocellatus]|uniref:ATPase involved in DNA repair n=1 Tax=Plakobranchus ocellatus TaxID=259542 RepID=A0AAV4C2M6_9GAST|nr:ATPase involved in DNA repair [Plakobranchus ocellatus]